MYGTNLVIICGTLGRPPEYRQFPNGSEVSNFTVATTDPLDKSTIWHRIVAKGPLGNICANKLQKGSIVTVQGHLSYRNYRDPATGVEKEVAEIIAHKIDIMPDSTNRNAANFEHQYDDQQSQNGFGYQNQGSRTSAPQYNKPFNNGGQSSATNQGYPKRQSNSNYMGRNRDFNQGGQSNYDPNFQNYSNSDNHYPKGNGWNNPQSQEERKFHYQQTTKE